MNIKDAFVPPKPKELDRAALTGISLEAVKGMKPPLKTGSGLVKLSVNGAVPCNTTNPPTWNEEYKLFRVKSLNEGI